MIRYWQDALKTYEYYEDIYKINLLQFMRKNLTGGAQKKVKQNDLP